MSRSRPRSGCRWVPSRVISAAACCGSGPGWRRTVAHTDPERLALIALGEQATGADAVHGGHLPGCPQCQAELDALRTVVEVARSPREAERLSAPPPGLWERIAAEAG